MWSKLITRITYHSINHRKKHHHGRALEEGEHLCVGYNYDSTAIQRRATVASQSNARRTAVESKSNRSCNHRFRRDSSSTL